LTDRKSDFAVDRFNSIKVVIISGIRFGVDIFILGVLIFEIIGLVVCCCAGGSVGLIIFNVIGFEADV